MDGKPLNLADGLCYRFLERSGGDIGKYVSGAIAFTILQQVLGNDEWAERMYETYRNEVIDKKLKQDEPWELRETAVREWMRSYGYRV